MWLPPMMEFVADAARNFFFAVSLEFKYMKTCIIMMDFKRLIPGHEPSAGDKIEEQIDNLCPSLTWTQRMIGFGCTAGV
jgi:hypothetical protein